MKYHSARRSAIAFGSSIYSFFYAETYRFLILVFFVSTIYVENLAAAAGNFSMDFSGGTFFGPGLMPDADMPAGRIFQIHLDEQLHGETPFLSNDKALPMISSGADSPFWSKGKLSNGAEFNEYLDGGIVEVGQGALKLLTVVTSEGNNKGKQFYKLNAACDWTILTDLALDPGFEQGIIHAHGLIITTGAQQVHPSLQTQMGLLGGVDTAGSIPAGVYVLGKLGDYDLDGWLDGTVVGAANIPLHHVFYPGASVLQTRNFKTNIPIAPFDAATVSVVSAFNYKYIFDQLLSKDSLKPEQDAYYFMHISDYLIRVKDILSASGTLLAEVDLDAVQKSIVRKASLEIQEIIRSVEAEITLAGDKSVDRYFISSRKTQLINIFEGLNRLSSFMKSKSVFKCV